MKQVGYCVNTNSTDSNHHIVHRKNCKHVNYIKRSIDLGTCENAYRAIRKAEEHFTRVDGCGFCLPDHTIGGIE